MKGDQSKGIESGRVKHRLKRPEGFEDLNTSDQCSMRHVHKVSTRRESVNSEHGGRVEPRSPLLKAYFHCKSSWYHQDPVPVPSAAQFRPVWPQGAV